MAQQTCASLDNSVVMKILDVKSIKLSLRRYAQDERHVVICLLHALKDNADDAGEISQHNLLPASPARPQHEQHRAAQSSGHNHEYEHQTPTDNLKYLIMLMLTSRLQC